MTTRSTIKNQATWSGVRLKRSFQYGQRLLRPSARPSLFIVGAQKAGTTSLFNYLNALPPFSGSQRKEVYFFNEDKRYSKGTAWYERFFNGYEQNSIHFEATPEYLYYPKAAVRIHQHYPDAKIIVLMREPIARAYSAWNMYYQWALKGFIPLAIHEIKQDDRKLLYSQFFEGAPPTFEDYVDFELRLLAHEKQPIEPSIIRRGLYADQVSRYLELFGSSQVLILGFRELVEQPEKLIARIQAFVNKDSNYTYTQNSRQVHNPGRYIQHCPEKVSKRLEEFYAPFNERLWTIIGHQIPW